MHSITLSFPTVEAMAAAIGRLLITDRITEAVQIGNSTRVTGEANTATAGKLKAEKSAAPAASAAPAPTPAALPKEVAAAPATAKGVDYPTLQKAVFELAGLADKKGLDKSVVLDIAKAHGGDNFKGLKPDTYAAALADVQAKIVVINALEESVA